MRSLPESAQEMEEYAGCTSQAQNEDLSPGKGNRSDRGRFRADMDANVGEICAEHSFHLGLDIRGSDQPPDFGRRST
jgi:hypothetical protein